MSSRDPQLSSREPPGLPRLCPVPAPGPGPPSAPPPGRAPDRPAPPPLLPTSRASQPRAARATSAASPGRPAGQARPPPGSAVPGHGAAAARAPQGKPPGPSLPASAAAAAPPHPIPARPAGPATSSLAQSSAVAHPPRGAALTDLWSPTGAPDYCHLAGCANLCFPGPWSPPNLSLAIGPTPTLRPLRCPDLSSPALPSPSSPSPPALWTPSAPSCPCQPCLLGSSHPCRSTPFPCRLILRNGWGGDVGGWTRSSGLHPIKSNERKPNHSRPPPAPPCPSLLAGSFQGAFPLHHCWRAGERGLLWRVCQAVSRPASQGRVSGMKWALGDAGLHPSLGSLHLGHQGLLTLV